MEGGYAFICKIQSPEILVSLCVARCLCKYMNKNENEQEKGIHLAHTNNNGIREGLVTLLFIQLEPPNNDQCMYILSDCTFIYTTALSCFLCAVPPILLI